MTRKTIQLPEQFQFTTDYHVLYSDINAANHLASDRILPITTEAQHRFIKSLGYDDAMSFDGIGLIMVHSETQYISETRHGDKLIIELAVDNLADKSLEFLYRIYNDTEKKETAALRVSMLFYNYEQKSVTKAPESVKEKLLASAV